MPERSVDDTYSLRVSVTEFMLHFAVFDDLDQPVRDIRKEEVEVFDKGRGPFPLSSLQLAPTLPVRVAVLLDTSTSMAGARTLALQQAAAVLDLVAADPTSLGTTLVFGRSIQRLQSWTSNSKLLRNSFLKGAWRSPGSDEGTGLFDAINTTCTYEFAHQQSSSASRLLFVLSDGVDTASHMSMLEAINSCVRAQTHIFGIQPQALEHRDTVGASVLSEIANSTGGKLIVSTTGADLQSRLRVAASTFTEGYVGSFNPPSKQGFDVHSLILVGPERARTIVVQPIRNENKKRDE